MTTSAAGEISPHVCLKPSKCGVIVNDVSLAARSAQFVKTLHSLQGKDGAGCKLLLCVLPMSMGKGGEGGGGH